MPFFYACINLLCTFLSVNCYVESHWKLVKDMIILPLLTCTSFSPNQAVSALKSGILSELSCDLPRIVLKICFLLQARDTQQIRLTINTLCIATINTLLNFHFAKVHRL